MDYKKVFKDRERRLKLINMLSFIPDKPYLKLVYKIKTGRKLNLKNPTGYNEKLNWMKLYDRHPEYTDCVDKIKAKEIVDGLIGKGHTIKTLGVWNSFDEIDFDKLPEQFVLKCNHDSGSVRMIRDKEKIDREELRKFFEGRLKVNSFNLGREYPYKNVKPRIFAEELVKNLDSGAINDYKFFCFNGEPKLMFVATDRDTDCRFDFFDMDFNHLDIQNIHPNADVIPEKPEKFEEMKEIARKLTKDIPCVRLDLYQIENEVYFSEYTFFHGGGFWLFKPEEWEEKLGKMITVI